MMKITYLLLLQRKKYIKGDEVFGLKTCKTNAYISVFNN